MNKKYLILGGGIIIIILIGFFLSFSLKQAPSTQQTSPQASSPQSQDTATFQSNQKSPAVSVTMAPPASTPQDATKQFYMYYLASPSNPLANGAYKTNPYLSQEFKQVIGALYKNGNVPVFCPQNLRDKFTVSQEEQVNYTSGVLMQEVISGTSGTKDLYRVMLKNVNGKWLIYDINCIE